MEFSNNTVEINTPNILVVDDDVSIAKIVREFLVELDYNVTICHRGQDALSYLENNSVDLVLLDVIMPEMCGLDVAKTIRENESAYGFIPIIMVSAMGSEDDKIRGLKYSDDYVTKPFSYDELRARIDALLRISPLQKEVLESKGRYKSLYENIPVMCLSLDKNWHIADCNTMFCECLGVHKNDIIEKCVFDFFTKKEHKTLLTFFKSLKSDKVAENNQPLELAVKKDQNNETLVTIKAVCLDDAKLGLYVIVAMKNVSDNIRLEKQQKLARQQLYRSARLASIGTLASGIAHEINNPLAAVLGFTDALLYHLDDDESIDENELKQYLGIIKSETLRCRDVVENVSKFSGDYDSLIERISLADCLNSAVTLMNIPAQKNGVLINNAIASDIIVNTDAHKIGRVLINILSNSIDFCKDGDSITITVEDSGNKHSMVKVFVVDTGPGIDESELPKIFDPFYTTKEVGRGIGLGMSISYKLMEECGGTIDVSSKSGEGTTVVLEIPKK